MCSSCVCPPVLFGSLAAMDVLRSMVIACAVDLETFFFILCLCCFGGSVDCMVCAALDVFWN